jgi:nicotinate-nucleotide adenylyltransferase
MSSENRLPRWGIYGGTFDPVHLGHVHFAKQAFEALKLDRLLWVPAKQNPLKLQGPGASPEQRVAMLKLALRDAGETRWEVYQGELDRTGPSYMVDTVKALQSQTLANWVLLLGAEVASELPRWERPKELLSLVSLAIVNRAGSNPESARAAVSQLGAAKGVEFLELPLIDISSTAIRQKITSNPDASRARPTEDFPGLQRSVWRFIKENRLYTVE